MGDPYRKLAPEMAVGSRAMIRHLELKNSITHRILNDGTSATTLLIGRTALDRILIALFLLRERLADRLVLTDRNKKLTMTALTHLQFGTYETSNEEFTACLTGTELELISSFLLKYHRDSEAEVDHIDVELDSGNSNRATLIIRAENARPPMTGVDA